MTDILDDIFISMGFPEKDLKASKIRGYLYTGMIFLTGMTTAFLLALILG